MSFDIKPSFFWRTQGSDPVAAFPNGIICRFYTGRMEIRDLTTGKFLIDVERANIEGQILRTFFNTSNNTAGVISTPSIGKSVSTVFNASNPSEITRILDSYDYEMVLNNMKTMFNVKRYNTSSALCVVKDGDTVVNASTYYEKETVFGEPEMKSPDEVTMNVSMKETLKHELIVASKTGRTNTILTRYDAIDRDLTRIIASPDGMTIAVLYHIKKDDSTEIDFYNLLSLSKSIGKIVSDGYNEHVAEFSKDGSQFISEGPLYQPTTGNPDRTIVVYDIPPPRLEQK